MDERSVSEVALIYVSVSTLRLPREAEEVDRIVDWSLGRNAELGVTGALIFTEKRFAQYLEGPAAGVDALMASIAGDPRHRALDVVFRRPIEERRFATWALAYAGPSTFVSGHVLTLAEAKGEAARLKHADRLTDVMQQFVQAQLAEQRRQRGG